MREFVAHGPAEAEPGESNLVAGGHVGSARRVEVKARIYQSHATDVDPSHQPKRLDVGRPSVRSQARGCPQFTLPSQVLKSVGECGLAQSRKLTLQALERGKIFGPARVDGRSQRTHRGVALGFGDTQDAVVGGGREDHGADQLLGRSHRSGTRVSAQPPMIPRGGRVFHLPRVKSGTSTAFERDAVDVAVSSTMELHAAAS